MGVWVEDNISPATHLYCYKASSPYLLWTAEAVSRWINNQQLTLVTLPDNSFLKIQGEFIYHFAENNDSTRLRGFTIDTIPISIQTLSQQKI